MIHRYYPYGETDTDFWLHQPKEMLTALKSYENLIEQASQEMYYIDMEA